MKLVKLALAAIAIAAASCSEPDRGQAALGDNASGNAAAGSPAGGSRAADWPMYHRDLAGTRYSPLDEITPANVADLELAWRYRFNRADRPRISGPSPFEIYQQITPIVVDGVMYLPAGDRVVALDPDTGTEIWVHELDEGLASFRGVAYWPGTGSVAPRILFTSLKTMIALEAADGRRATGFGDNGEIDLGVAYSGVPTIVGNRIVIGANFFGPGEVHIGPQLEEPRGQNGNSRAYDAVTGAKVWEYNTIPQPGEPGHDTWGQDSWRNRTGNNVWTFALTADEAAGLVYMPVSTPGANYYGGDRPGNNEPANSIVALDAATGEVRWYFQTIHHELWDYNLPPAAALVDLTVDGRTIPALAQTGKSGFLFILDRLTGEPVFGVEETPVPAGDVPGEWYAPTQPIPLKPPPVARVRFDPATDIVRPEDTTPAHAAACRERFDEIGYYNAGPYTPFNLRADGTPPSLVFPSLTGGVNWGGVAIDPERKLIFVNSKDESTTGWTVPNPRYSEATADTQVPYTRGNGPAFSAPLGEGLTGNAPCHRPPWASLMAIDAEAGEIVWSVPLGVNENLPGDRQDVGSPGYGGPMVTAGGLVFIGATGDQRFRAFDAANGAEVWSTRLPYTITAIPMSFAGASGRQYVAVTAARSGQDPPGDEGLYVFALPAGARAANGSDAMNSEINNPASGATAEATAATAGSARATSPITASAVAARPPAPEKRSFEVTAPHGATRVDEYYWLRDDEREDGEMLAHLTAENVYADAALEPLGPLRDRLYDELVGRIKQDDSSVPFREKGYWYYTRYETGQEYPIHARRRGELSAPEEILLDANALAAGHDFYQIADYEPSPDQQTLAWLEDTVGRRQYTLKLRDLASGTTADVAIPGLAAGLAWSADSLTVYYVENDPETLLTKRIKAHRLGTDPAADAVVYEEPDDAFYISVRNSRSDEFICIDASSTVSTETRCTSAAAPGEFAVIAPRERDFEYDADHLNGRWVILTNWQAENFRLMSVADDAIGDRAAWQELVPHDEAVFIDEFELFDDFIAIGERSGGLTRIRILREGSDEAGGGHGEYVAADEPAYSMELDVNAEPDTAWLRYVYTSMTTPDSTFELNVETGERRLLKEAPVLGGFDKADYVTERLYAPARDGTAIPVSLVYRRGFVPDGTAALVQYGYGSYGISMDPEFSGNVLSLVDRGAVYAIAHIRGGQEMGRHWYESGKLLEKQNTFTDFIDATAHLVAEGYAAPDRVAAMGGSAGGLLVGAVANMAPDSYRAIVSLVPFVDVVTTMLDPSIPLTTNEYDEWGNPEEAEYYDYMLTYSPYDRIAEQDYPAIYVYTGLWDSQVQYWEPAKYVARLRERATGDDLVVFRVEMEAGHGGQSGRFQRYREIAEQYAFLLNQLGLEG